MKPKTIFTLMEPTRTVVEALGLMLPHRTITHADPKNIMVIPGFMGTDLSTLALRRGLDRNGHYVTGWGEGLNTGLTSERLARLKSQIEVMDDDFILIGHSLGGIYARELAKVCPNVSKVICVCSPVNLNSADPVPTIEVIYRSMNKPDDSLIDQVSEAPECDSVHLYSKTDGIIHWEACRQPFGDNIEIHSSHCGSVMNRSVINLIGDLI